MKASAITIGALALGLSVPAGAAAANKEHQQLMAEIRMLQEQQQQLQQMLGPLADTLKAVTGKLDEQAGVSRKAMADQRLLIEGVGETVRILREKADDTNVRLGTMTQELQSLRQTVESMPAPQPAAPVPTGDPAEAGAVPPTTPPAQTTPPPAPPPGVSPQRMYDNAFADYTAGQWDLAILGFETFIKMFPRYELADDAQLNIGYSLFSAGKYQEAIQALQTVIGEYPKTNSVPAAYYKLGQSYEALKQPDLAKRAYETVIKNFRDANEATLAQQALERLNRASKAGGVPGGL
jgi:tol-pal system protein YbgF